ncbi:MAG: hypothetical protein EBU90_01905 [Proteobacteria bacterium]|nr:hypothetical protein [Pseudomonadota bacterium]NBP13236.1 hypothetical protein [bacterium]
MSTKIKDLPTPFVETESKTTAIQVQAQPVVQPQPEITATITPKYAQAHNEEKETKESFWSRLQGELSEENVLVYVFLYLSAMPETHKYLEFTGLPRGKAFVCFILVLGYIAIKLLVLPHLKV